MKIIFEDHEIDALPDDARKKLDGELEIEIETLSELSEDFEDVGGLKKALKRERVSRREAEHDLSGTRKRLEKAGDDDTLAERDAEIETLKTQLAERDNQIGTLQTDIKTTKQDAKIAEAVSKHKGDVDLLRPHLAARLEENPELDLDDIMPGIKEKHPGAFAGSSHSGGGSDPQKTGDTSFGRASISSMPQRRSEMSDKEKNEFQKANGLEALLNLPL